MSTIDEGMQRFEQFAPQGRRGGRGTGVISGSDAFKLYDTFGFPLDLTQLMAGERGYEVDVGGFEKALDVQRRRSREEREQQKRRGQLELKALDIPADAWRRYSDDAQEWVGYDSTVVDTDVLAAALQDGRAVLALKRNPFYAEAGGQVSDRGFVEGDGWRMSVDDVARIDDRVVVIGTLEGEFVPGSVRAVVDDVRRHTQRNHTATHLLHAALRTVLGEHVTQAGSLVAPDRLRFDFTHTGPLTDHEMEAVERLVNERIWANIEVTKEHTAYKEAIARGAMALFGEKYGDEVRVVGVPGFSLELCGGCHVRTTGEIGLFRVVAETGSAAGVRRIEAVTGSVAYVRVKEDEQLLQRVGDALRVSQDDLADRVDSLIEERRGLREQLKVNVHRAAEGDVKRLVEDATAMDGAKVAIGTITAADSEALRDFGDRLRAGLGTGIGVVAAAVGDKYSLLAVVTDDLIVKGVRADAVVREVAKLAGGKGGGRPHLAQGSVGGREEAEAALKKVPDIVRPMLEKAG